jgi:hypothetical protein
VPDAVVVAVPDGVCVREMVGVRVPVLDCVADSEAVPVCVPLKDAVDVVDGACASARTLRASSARLSRHGVRGSQNAERANLIDKTLCSVRCLTFDETRPQLAIYSPAVLFPFSLARAFRILVRH